MAEHLSGIKCKLTVQISINISWCSDEVYKTTNGFWWCTAGAGAQNMPPCDLMLLRHIPEEAAWKLHTWVFQHATYSPCSTLSYLAFLSAACSGCSSADWDTFQIPHSPSYQPVPAARLVFTLSRAPPCYHGDAAVTCQFRGGDAHRLVVAQNRMVGEFSLGVGEHNS